MTTVIIHHEVRDYDHWKNTFDATARMRREGGELDASLYRDADNPSIVSGVFRWKDASSARAFFGGDELKSTMAEAGVVGNPSIHLVQES